MVGEEYTTVQELLNITESWWKEHNVLQAHVWIIRTSIGTDEVRTPTKAPGILLPLGYGLHGMHTPANSFHVRGICR